MRPKIADGLKSKPCAVSLPPASRTAAKIKAFKLGISFSELVNRLILLDIKQNLIPLPKS